MQCSVLVRLPLPRPSGSFDCAATSFAQDDSSILSMLRRPLNGSSPTSMGPCFGTTEVVPFPVFHRVRAIDKRKVLRLSNDVSLRGSSCSAQDDNRLVYPCPSALIRGEEVVNLRPASLLRLRLSPFSRCAHARCDGLLSPRPYTGGLHIQTNRAGLESSASAPE
jgi:hypothetical protein